MSVEHKWDKLPWKPKEFGEQPTNCLFLIANPTWNSRELIPGLCDEKPVTEFLRFGATAAINF